MRAVLQALTEEFDALALGRTYDDFLSDFERRHRHARSVLGEPARTHGDDSSSAALWCKELSVIEFVVKGSR